MKRIFTIIAALLALILVACEKETVLTIDQTSLSFTDTGGSQTISLTANKPWSVKCDQSWCKVSPSSGEEAVSSKISISCDANTSYDARNCIVTFTCAELTKTVSISQATNNGLLVSQTSYELTKAAQQLNIQVQANVKFSVEVDAGCKDWITYKTTKGLTTNTVVLDIAENNSYDSREGKVTIKQDGGNLSSTVVIKQGQTNGLFLTTSEYNLSNENHTLTVEVKSNIDFEVKSEADWIKYVETKGLKTNQIVLDVEANETYDTREGKVTVKQKNGDLTGSITVRQDQNYGILVSQSEYNLTNEAQTIDVEIKYNVDFDVIIPDGCKDWISFVSTKSLDSRIYTFSIAKNETYDDREGSITFKQKDGTKSGTVCIKQKQLDHLSVEKEEYLVSSEAQTLSIKVEANIDYDVEIDELSNSWLSVGETKALSKSNVLIKIAKNDGDHRTGGITLKGNEEKVRVRIEQEGINPVIIYTTTDGLPVWPNSVEVSDKLEIISNSYENGVGRLVLCDTVTVLPRRAFYQCNTLTSVRIPNGIKSIGYQAFRDCISLESIDLPNSITDICTAAFYSCESLKSFSFPPQVTHIDSWVLAFCENLEYVHIPESVKTIGDSAFGSCHSLNSTTIPTSVELIDRYAFGYCTSLLSISIPGSVKEIRAYAFEHCSALESVMLNDGIEIIGEGAFIDCSSLQSVTIPGTVKEVGKSLVIVRSEGVFENCTNLKSAIIGNGVTILHNTFSNCTSLTDVVLPDSVTSLPGTFWGCISLTDILIPDSVTSLAGTFGGCSSLKSVKLPPKLQSMTNTFSDCSSLTEIEIPETVTDLGTASFYGCENLTKVNIPDGITRIDYASFLECSSLPSIDLPEGVTYIGDRAFEGCGSLTNITIPSTVDTLGCMLFYRCRMDTITLLPIRPPFLFSSIFFFSSCRSIRVPKESLEAYLSDNEWKKILWGDIIEEMD